MTNPSPPVLEVDGLVKHFPIHSGLFNRSRDKVRAVDGVSFSVAKGEVLGLVGESGSGKTTVGRTVLRLDTPTDGAIRFLGHDITRLSRGQLRPFRRQMQLVFQDPFSSLNPRMRVDRIVGAPLAIHEPGMAAAERASRVEDALAMVGLPRNSGERFPHEFSGGQRQRIGIARGIALNPKIIICDEPVSALDVSVQAQVVNLLEALQDELGLAYVFIAHDLSVVRHISDRVAVMYLGKIVEIGDEEQIYGHPTHPYTQALLSAVPVPDPTVRDRRTQIMLTGDVPSPANPPSGCRFHTRCWRAQELCRTTVPELIERPDGAGMHRSACHFAEELPEVVAAD